MRAAVLTEVGGPLAIEEVVIDNPGPREVLIRTAASGLCHSDLHYVDGLWPGEMPMVLGHEAAGIVEKSGADVRYVQPGDPVITCLSVFCGTCAACVSGKPYTCDNKGALRRAPGETPRLRRGDGQGLHQLYDLGAYAEQMLVHENALVKIRRDMPLDRAALIGCAVTTGVGSVVRGAKVEFGSTVAVVGCGGIGLSAVNGAAIAGASRIVAVDVLPAKLELARKVGATDLVDASKVDPVEAVRELTGGGVDYAFEALGKKKTAEQCFAMLRRSGTATVIGMLPVGETIAIPGDRLLDDLRIQGSNMGSNRFRIDMPVLVDFYLDGRLKLDTLVAETIRLDDVNAGLDRLRSGHQARSVIRFPD
jgi:S-(hydroxymethyl)glutathione dehydrogenase/alcohol dehydrogenase